MSSDYKKTQNIFPHPKRDDLKKAALIELFGLYLYR